MQTLLFICVFVSSVFAQRSPLSVNGVVVNNPNFPGTQFTATGSTVALSPSIAFTNNSHAQIDLGSGTSFILNPLLSRYSATATGNFTFSLATNSVSSGIEYLLYVDVYDAAGGKTALSSGGRSTGRGNINSYYAIY